QATRRSSRPRGARQIAFVSCSCDLPRAQGLITWAKPSARALEGDLGALKPALAEGEKQRLVRRRCVREALQRHVEATRRIEARGPVGVIEIEHCQRL